MCNYVVIKMSVIYGYAYMLHDGNACCLIKYTVERPAQAVWIGNTIQREVLSAEHR